MLHAAFAAPLMALAVAFPFLFSYTQPPSTNFWPLMAAGLCGWVVAVAWNARRVDTVRGGWMDRSEMTTWLSAGLLLPRMLIVQLCHRLWSRRPERACAETCRQHRHP